MKVTDDDAYEGLGGDKAAQITYKVDVVSVGLGPQRGYVAVNNDDDDENGKMDKYDGGTQSAENDLVKIMLSVDTPRDDDTVKLCVTPEAYKDRIKFWSHRDKQNEVTLTKDEGVWCIEWASGSVPESLYIEGMQASPALANRYPWPTLTYIDGYGDGVARDPPAEIRFTVLDLDMDIDGVKDDENTYCDVTEETTPGGFIPLHDVVKITLREPLPTLYSLLPIDVDHPVTLRAVSGGSKIRIWENESKTGDPVSLPASYIRTNADCVFNTAKCYILEAWWDRDYRDLIAPNDEFFFTFSPGGTTIEMPVIFRYSYSYPESG